MILFENPRMVVSQGWFSGWKVQDKTTGAIAVPGSALKERIGLVWMQVRRTKKSLSIDSQMSEEVMFGSFGHAVLDPTSLDGRLWLKMGADELADIFISDGNGFINDSLNFMPDRWR